MPEMMVQFYKKELWQEYIAQNASPALLAQLSIYLRHDKYDHFFYHTAWYEKLALSLCGRKTLSNCEKNNYRFLIKEAINMAINTPQIKEDSVLAEILAHHPLALNTERTKEERAAEQKLYVEILKQNDLLPQGQPVKKWLEQAAQSEDKIKLYFASGTVGRSFWSNVLQEVLASCLAFPANLQSWQELSLVVEDMLKKYQLSNKALANADFLAELGIKEAVQDSPKEQTKEIPMKNEPPQKEEIWQTRIIPKAPMAEEKPKFKDNELSADEANEKGIRLFKGEGVEADQEQAVQLFAQAARGGSLEGQYNLAFCYLGGFGIAQDGALALKWYTQAAQGGYLPAMCKLGEIYEKGQGKIAPDSKLSLQWYERAALEGHAESQFKTAQYYANGEGTEQNYDKAAKFYLLAAQNNHSQAQYNYGICCYLGLGRAKDLKESFEWYQKAADNGLASAQNELANCYFYASGTERNLSEALHWYKVAANAGNAAAQCNLAIRYYLGEGVKENNAEAFKWFQLSAAQNYAEAQNYLGLCYDNGYGTKKDPKAAFAYYSLAYAQNNSDGANNLALCYYYGTGVKKDKAKAKEIFLNARDWGSKEAKENLRKFYKI